MKFIKKYFSDTKNILDEIFSKEFLLNENFNGRLTIKSDDLKKNLP